jgi:hypothetical protein
MGCEAYARDVPPEEFDAKAVGDEVMIAVSRVFARHGINLDHLAVMYNFTRMQDGAQPELLLGLPHLPDTEEHQGCHLHNLALGLAMLDPTLRGGMIQIIFDDGGGIVTVGQVGRDDFEELKRRMVGDNEDEYWTAATMKELREFQRRRHRGDEPDA